MCLSWTIWVLWSKLKQIIQYFIWISDHTLRLVVSLSFVRWHLKKVCVLSSLVGDMIFMNLIDNTAMHLQVVWNCYSMSPINEYAPIHYLTIQMISTSKIKKTWRRNQLSGLTMTKSISLQIETKASEHPIELTLKGHMLSW